MRFIRLPLLTIKTNKMKKIYKQYQLGLILCLSPIFLLAQLSVTGGQTANDLASNILGTGVTISNATLISTSNSTGIFSNGNTTNIGVDEGILLTSGRVGNAVGPNSAPDTSSNNNAAGDADLDALITTTTNDASVLEFDFVPEGTSISFNYVFASEEYEEYYCSNYNDVFAFFVSGPNPGGGSFVNENIAIVPSSGDVVSINNVGPGICAGIDNSGEYNNNFGGATIEYDGFLNVFSASINLVPCQEYHIKLAIADAGDRILDSGVFIEAGSFVSSNVVAEAILTDPMCPGGSDGSINVTVISGVSPFTFLWENGDITEDRTGLSAGTYTVEIIDAIDCSKETFTYIINDGIDVTGPTLACNDITVVLDAGGNASILASDVVQATDLCGVDDISIDLDQFSCLLQDYTVNVIATDVNGNTSICSVIVTLAGDDEDCDGVADACDLCPGGDDQVDANNDGNPDCAFPPPFDEILDAWKCGKKKVYMCHIPPGNPANAHTICINKNAISAHLAHGDYLGPCGNASCSSKISENITVREINDQDFIIYPNPVRSTLFVEIQDEHHNATITLRNHLGQTLKVLQTDNHMIEINLEELSVQNGLYFISLEIEGDIKVKKFIVNQ